jgi:hypothetical protein
MASLTAGYWSHKQPGRARFGAIAMVSMLKSDTNSGLWRSHRIMVGDEGHISVDGGSDGYRDETVGGFRSP